MVLEYVTPPRSNLKQLAICSSLQAQKLDHAVLWKVYELGLDSKEDPWSAISSGTKQVEANRHVRAGK